MSEFLDLCRRALKYRGTLLGSLACSLLVGVLWGANIGTLYPLLQVVLSGESFNDAIQRKLDTAEAEVCQLREELQALDVELEESGESASVALLNRQNTCETRLAALDEQTSHLAKWKPWVDRLLPQDPFETLALVVAFVFVATVLKGVFLASNEILVTRLTELSLMNLRKRVYRHTLTLDVADFARDRTSRLLSRITHDTNRVGEGLRALFGGAIREPFKMLACLVGAAIVSWRLLLIVLLVAPIGALGFLWLHRQTRALAKAGMAAMADLYASITDSFSGIQTVKAYTLERPMRRRFHSNSKSIYSRLLRLSVARSVIKPLVESTGMAAVSIALLLGAYLVTNRQTHLLGVPITDGPMAPMTLMMFYAFLIGVIDPARKLSNVTVSIQRSAVAAERVGRLLQRRPKVQSPERGSRRMISRGTLQFDQVSFHYRKGHPILTEIDLDVRERECIAIVGANGCGKSTLVSLIPRFYDPTTGRVTIGGTDIRETSVVDLRRRVGLVTQTTKLMDDTVLNNIKCGAPYSTECAAREAAQLVGAESFIHDQLSDGYETIVGEGHAFVSGGQAQRIALARAVLRNPDILILDEATSALDADSEAEVLERLTPFIRARTSIFVTHRPAPLPLADRIVVMDHGAIVAVGTWQELSKESEFIQRLDQHNRNRQAA